VASLDNRSHAMPDRWAEHPWSATRGAPSALSDEQRALRLGALGVDLEELLASRDTAAAGVAEEMATLLADLPAAAPVSALLRQSATPLRDGSNDGMRSAREARRAATQLVDSVHLGLGAWLEAGRIAAARHDSAFIASTTFDATRERLAGAAGLPAELAAALGSRLAAPSTAEEWRALETRFTELLRTATR
jgi:hypothetical protein